MKRKGDAHETMSLFFKKYDVPHKMVIGVSKGKTLWLVRKNFQEADCHII